MVFKKVILFGLFLFCVLQSYAQEISNKEIEQEQSENNHEKIFCSYNMFDWFGSSKYDEQSDEIIIENCKWGYGYECDTYKISKLVEFDGIRIYYNEKYPENTFINDNGNWKWDKPGCRFVEPTGVVKDK